ncbi:acetyl-CoA carboxylase carboxyltransferase subunit alpha [Liberiplasma polymorphum]|uniref:acetyl-CoA carboxylase carboxyltransferase subunit alpha n=1 Tax=Liberiplasma polymorphum TaxID=3374570 RepID=UPI0037720620
MDILQKEKKLKKLEEELYRLDDQAAIDEIKETINDYKIKAMSSLTSWDRVLLARHQQRPNAKAFIDNVFDDFIELHGDRSFADDRAIIGGIGMINNIPVTIIAQQKGTTTEENIACNFAMAHPEGYRKALRLMKQAEKFNRPIITFIDTPGAYPGIGAEARGQGEAIARNLYEMSDLGVPIIAIVIGEGGSGGALAIGMGNEVFMLENSIYSILSPEGYASILWKDSTKAKEAAEVMKLTSFDLEELGIIDGIITEPLGGAHHDPIETFEEVKDTIIESLARYQNMSHFEIKTARYAKYRNIGFFQRFNYEHLKGVVK